ncbi:hypothetical protein Bbelb_394610 [Branchiostoma belcheri]|nr:hypothetical protein Bbelb_394610 [Branchiostoma belcheri]
MWSPFFSIRDTGNGRTGLLWATTSLLGGPPPSISACPGRALRVFRGDVDQGQVLGQDVHPAGAGAPRGLFHPADWGLKFRIARVGWSGMVSRRAKKHRIFTFDETLRTVLARYEWLSYVG